MKFLPVLTVGLHVRVVMFILVVTMSFLLIALMSHVAKEVGSNPLKVLAGRLPKSYPGDDLPGYALAEF